jgi:putative chitinase
MITEQRLRRFAPSARQDIVDALVAGEDDIVAAGIDTPQRLAHFMAQIATETGGFTIYEENLNYTAQRMTEVWPSHFHTLAEAQPFARNPEKLANFIYADANRAPRFRLGNTQEGDGWKYRGRGLIQTTGRNSYRRFHHEDDPDVLNDPKVGLEAAYGEFVESGCIRFADADQVEEVRKRINGGQTGIADCRVFLLRAKQIFKAEEDAVEPWDKPRWQRFPDPKLAWVQDALNRLEDAGLEVDGVTGTNTKKAIRAFQTKHHLSVDGTAGDGETIPAIKAALGI